MISLPPHPPFSLLHQASILHLPPYHSTLYSHQALPLSLPPFTPATQHSPLSLPLTSPTFPHHSQPNPSLSPLASGSQYNPHLTPQTASSYGTLSPTSLSSHPQPAPMPSPSPTCNLVPAPHPAQPPGFAQLREHVHVRPGSQGRPARHALVVSLVPNVRNARTDVPNVMMVLTALGGV
jgi:hypothetical protein